MLRKLWRGLSGVQQPDERAGSPWDTSGSYSLMQDGAKATPAPRQPISKRRRIALICAFMVIGFALTGLGLAQNNVLPGVIFAVVLWLFHVAQQIRHYLETEKTRKLQKQEALEILELQKQGLISEEVDARAVGTIPRAYSLLLFLFAMGIVAGNWCWQIYGGHGSKELALLAPTVGAAFLGMAINPALGSVLKSKKDEFVLGAWIVAGLVLGGLNLYWMSL